MPALLPEPVIAENFRCMNNNSLGDPDILTCDSSGAMRATSIGLEGAAPVAVTPLGWEEGQIDLWDSTLFELVVFSVFLFSLLPEPSSPRTPQRKQQLSGDTDTLTCDCSGAMRAMSIDIEGATPVAVTPLGREEGQPDL